MRHRRAVAAVRSFLLPLVVVAAGCGDGTGPEGDLRFTGSWDGTEWVGDAQAFFIPGAAGTDTLYLYGVRPSSAGQYQEEIITVRVPFDGPGLYELSGEAVDVVLLTGGDIVEGRYHGHRPKAGTLDLDSYDPASALLTGTVAFDAEAELDFQPYGPAARFVGSFRARVRRLP
jgi:hypothetical protein